MPTTGMRSARLLIDRTSVRLICCRWRKTMTIFSAVSLNLEMAVNTKSSQLTCLRPRRIHLLLHFLLLKRQVQVLNPLYYRQESIRKTGLQMTSTEAGRVLLDFHRTYAHEQAHQLARQLPPARRCPHKTHRVCFSTGQVIIGFPLLVSHYIPLLEGDSAPTGRTGRDTPLHNNVQLLQKQGLDRSREVRRDTTSSQGTEDRRWERGRRPSNATTTHSAISGGRDSSRESLRQLPPHFTSAPKSLPPLSTHQLPHVHPPSSRQSSTREPWRPERSSERSAVIPSPSDLSSHFASPTTPSVVALSPQALTAAPTDIEFVRKAAMHSAAERAKIRRQREEEEREKERERARKKAAEMAENRKTTAEEETQEDPTSQVGFLSSVGEITITNQLAISGDTARTSLYPKFHGACPGSTARQPSTVIKTCISRPSK